MKPSVGSVPYSREASLLRLEDSELLEVPGRPSEIALGARIRNLAPVSMGPRERAEVMLPPFEMVLRDGRPAIDPAGAQVRIDGEVRDLTEDIKLDRYFQHSIEVVVDRLVVREEETRNGSPQLEARFTIETYVRPTLPTPTDEAQEG